MAKFAHSVTSTLSVEAFISALTEFSERRLQIFPTIDPRFYKVYSRTATSADVGEGSAPFGGIWGREHYDWSQPGVVTLELVESADFRPGTRIVYRVTAASGGGCHVAVDFQRIARSVRGRFVGAVLQLSGPGRFAGELRTALERLARIEP